MLRPYLENALSRLLSANEVATAILLPAAFVALRAEGLFLAEADRGQAVGGNAQGDEILLHGSGAAVPECQVVFRRAALVAVPFDGHAKLRIVAQEVRGLGKSFAGIGADIGFIEIEVGVPNFSGKELVRIHLGLRFHRW